MSRIQLRITLSWVVLSAVGLVSDLARMNAQVLYERSSARSLTKPGRRSPMPGFASPALAPASLAKLKPTRRERTRFRRYRATLMRSS